MRIRIVVSYVHRYRRGHEFQFVPPITGIHLAALCNGYNVAFRPKRMTPAELHAAHRELWRRAFAPAASLARIARGARQLYTVAR